jgi:uncharacterized protein
MMFLVTQKRTRVFQPGHYDLQVKRSRAGLGLFTNSPIKKDACIIEYVGKVVPKEEWDSHMGKYLFEVSKRKVIDGSSRKNLARYINHDCKPNGKIRIFKERVYIMAKRNIKAGEELGYDYDKEYFDAYIKPFGCRCASCRAKGVVATKKKR